MQSIPNESKSCKNSKFGTNNGKKCYRTDVTRINNLPAFCRRIEYNDPAFRIPS